MIWALYIASAFGAVALLLMMPRRGFNPRAIGVLLAAATLGALWLYLGRSLPQVLGIDAAAMGYYYAFSGIAIFAAARMITHTRPVFSALWFIMVVLAVTGLLILLSAEFMAAALVIIYGGAILVTYLFVLMLAAPPETPGSSTQATGDGGYDRTAREPVLAVIVGHILLAALLTVFFEPMTRNYDAADASDAVVIAEALTDRPAQRLADRFTGRGEPIPADVQAEMLRLDNVERVGLDLFRSHPLGIELAGVVLLVALIGAVVMARQSSSLPDEQAQQQEPQPPTT